VVNSHDTSSGTANRALLDLLCEALDARSEDQVAGSLRECQQHANAEMLLRLSALSALMERTIEMFGLPNRLRDSTMVSVSLTVIQTKTIKKHGVSKLAILLR